jgi:chromosome segregation ATPase
MNKIGTFIGIKPNAGTASEIAENALDIRKMDKNVVELDSELFLPMATQVGEDNEAIRNLMIDVEHKVGELESIKSSFGKLLDPVSKALRALEEAKSEKISLQGALNNIRITNNRLRGDLEVTEKKVAVLDSECSRLRETLTIAQQKMGSVETTRAEQTNELTTRRAQVADLQRRLQQQGVELQVARDEYRRLSERVTQGDKRAVQLETEGETMRQKFLVTDKERTTLKTSLEKAYSELSQVSQRLLDTDKALAAAQNRVQKAELALNETQAERHRLASTLDNINQKHQNEISSHRTNFETLQARCTLTEKLLDEARQCLMERAEEVRTFDRRLGDSTRMHSVIGEKLGLIEEALAERNARIKELDQARAGLAEQNDLLTKAVSTRENAYNRAQEHILSLEERIQLLENEAKAIRQTNETEIEMLNAKLQREQIARTMAEGAVEAGRKDIARLLHEVATAQYSPPSPSTMTEISTEPPAVEQSETPSTQSSKSAQAA